MNDLAHIQKAEGWLSPSFVSLYSLNSNKYRISGSGRAQAGICENSFAKVCHLCLLGNQGLPT